MAPGVPTQQIWNQWFCVTFYGFPLLEFKLCSLSSTVVPASLSTSLFQSKCMPQQPNHSPEVCQLINEACIILKGQKKPNIAQVICNIKNCTGTDIPYGTVCHLFLGISLPPCEAHSNQQLLSPEAERTLVDWVIFLSDTSHPLNKWSIWMKAQALCRTKPSDKWTRGFLGWHPEIKLGRPSGLDPKHAQAFNKSTIHKHFCKLHQLIQKHDIPVENMYNMDEKGCQRGGGCKGSNQKCLIPCRHCPKYMSCSTNLELITMIEFVCADGMALLPGLVFSGKDCNGHYNHMPDLGKVWCGGRCKT